MSGAQPASVRKVRRASSPALTQVTARVKRSATQGVDGRLEQPRAVALRALRGVEGDLGQLAVGDGVTVGVRGRRGQGEAHDLVALEGDEHAVARVSRTREDRPPLLGDGVHVGRQHLGRQQAGVELRPMPGPARQRSPPRRRPRRPARTRRHSGPRLRGSGCATSARAHR